MLKNKKHRYIFEYLKRIFIREEEFSIRTFGIDLFKIKILHISEDCILRSEIFDSVLTIFFLPKAEVLLKEFNDGLGISESLLIDIIDVLKCLAQSLLTEFACFLVIAHHFVLEYGEVEGETKSNWVTGIQAC